MDLVRNLTADNKKRLEGDVFFPLFNAYIRLRAEAAAPLDFVHRCAEYLNSLNPTLMDELCRSSIRYCHTFRNAVGEPKWAFQQPREVLKLITPRRLLVPLPMNGPQPVIHLELDCAWEEEHGLEWIFRDDRVIYTGGFGSHNPWRDHKESWNYA